MKTVKGNVLTILGIVAADILIIGLPHHWHTVFTGVNPRPELNALRLARFCSHETSLLHCVQYFLRGFTLPKKAPQRSQYLISIFIRFTCLFGFPIVTFKALIDKFLHPQYLVGIVS